MHTTHQPGPLTDPGILVRSRDKDEVLGFAAA